MTSVSFIIPAYNEQEVLGRTLAAITQVAGRLTEGVEVIVVDDASTDRTADIARAHGAQVIPVRHRQISATRNAGARAAQGEWLVFVDADTVVSEALVRAALAALRAGAVGGGCSVRFDGPLPDYARPLLAVALPLYRALRLAAGCFVFCTREAFNAVGGFSEGVYAAEEALLSVALRRHGRFVMLRESVLTSGRKLRTHSGGEILGTLLRVAFAGRKALGRREALALWYGERRADPDSDA